MCPVLGPGRPSIVRNTGDQPMGSAIRPAVLLEDADDVVRVSRVDGDPWFNLGVDIVGARPTDGTTGEGACWTRDLRDGRAGMDQDTPSRGQEGQGNYKYR